MVVYTDLNDYILNPMLILDELLVETMHIAGVSEYWVNGRERRMYFKMVVLLISVLGVT